MSVAEPPQVKSAQSIVVIGSCVLTLPVMFIGMWSCGSQAHPCTLPECMAGSWFHSLKVNYYHSISQEYTDPSITITLIPVNISIIPISMQEVQMN